MSELPDGVVRATPQTGGDAAGRVVALGTPVSFWGGVGWDGVLVDAHHPDRGVRLGGCVLAMTVGRGSSSSSSVLAELIRTGVAPAAIVLSRPDSILALGSLVAAELYGVAVPIVTVTDADLATIAGWAQARVISDPGAGKACVRR